MKSIEELAIKCGIYKPYEIKDANKLAVEYIRYFEQSDITNSSKSDLDITGYLYMLAKEAIGEK
jgi:hypothetical protein